MAEKKKAVKKAAKVDKKSKPTKPAGKAVKAKAVKPTASAAKKAPAKPKSAPKKKTAAAKPATARKGSARKVTAPSKASPKKAAPKKSAKAAPKKSAKAAPKKSAVSKSAVSKSSAVSKARAPKKAAPPKKAVVKKSTASGVGAKKPTVKPARPTKPVATKPVATKPVVKAVGKKAAAPVAQKSEKLVKKAALGGRSVAKPATQPPAKPAAEPSVLANGEAPAPPVRRKPLFPAKVMKELREALLAERARLLSEMRSHESRAIADDEDDSQKPGFSLQLADSASDIEEREKNYKIYEIESHALREIEDALQAMETGEYGYCQGTGEPIELERLRVKPWARFSVKYLNSIEQRKRRSAA